MNVLMYADNHILKAAS